MTTTRKYCYLDHTADLGLEIYGRNQEELFANACFALFDQIVSPDTVFGEQEMEISVAGLDLADLMFNWLRELLTLWTVEERLVSSVTVTDAAANALCARLGYDRFKVSRHLLKSEVKAVTYHDLTVEKTGRGWRARVVFDV